MAKEINEDTQITIPIKTLIGILFGIATLIGGFYTVKYQIDEAKELPKPIMTKTEYELKDQLIRQTIMDTKSDVDEIKLKLSEIEKKLK